jgi:hypothetical protein
MIISIDVGIKNLSYCVLCKDTEGIIKWDVLDLSTDTEKPKCCQAMKKKICGKNASFTHGGNNFYCGTHAKTCDIDIAPEIYYKIKKSKRVAKKWIAELRSHFSLENTSEDHLVEHTYLNCITKLDKAVSASNIDLIDIGKAISKRLPDEINIGEIDTVLIENQISPIANRMKCIQGMITQFFIEKGVNDIHFISSSNKLKHFDVPKKSYKERKSSGIAVMLDLLKKEQINSWNTMFASHKKKDDLADSYLQGLWFIRHSSSN